MRRAAVATGVLAAVLLAGCSDDDGGRTGLAPLLLEPGDLPDRFEPSDTVDDTLTTVCAGQDATTGLQATDRAVVGFRSEPPGLAVVQILLELGPEGAATFVAQATELLEGCDSVPDLAGLAFEYAPVPAEVDDLLAAGSDGHVARRGVSVGSGSFVLDLAFFHRGGTAQLVAVIGLDEDPDALHAEVLAAALDR